LGFIATKKGKLRLTRGEIDYVTVVMAIIVVYAIAYWFVRARKEFKGVERIEKTEAREDTVSN
jgi:hypothetical protein